MGGAIEWALRDMIVIGYREGLVSAEPYSLIRSSTSADREKLVSAMVALALTLTANEAA